MIRRFGALAAEDMGEIPLDVILAPSPAKNSQICIALSTCGPGAMCA